MNAIRLVVNQYSISAADIIECAAEIALDVDADVLNECGDKAAVAEACCLSDNHPALTTAAVSAVIANAAAAALDLGRIA